MRLVLLVALVAACSGSVSEPDPVAPIASDDALALAPRGSSTPATPGTDATGTEDPSWHGTDANLPPVFEGRIPLADGASLGLVGKSLGLDQGKGLEVVFQGQLLGRPAVDASGTVVVFGSTVGDGLFASLVRLRQVDGVWETHTLIKSGGEADRVAVDPEGARAAFVWSGPEGGVAAIYVIDLRAERAEPVRLTNLAPFKPGQPPDDFLPLPVGEAPVFDGDVLRWRSEAGRHSVDVPR